MRAEGIEVYDSMKLRKAAGLQQKEIAMHDLESSTLRYVCRMRDMLDKLGFNPPYHVFISLIGVRDLTVYVPTGAWESPIPIRQKDLLLPEMVLERPDDALIKVVAKLKPVFDVVWNAAGMSESPNFKEALAKEKQGAV